MPESKIERLRELDRARLQNTPGLRYLRQHVSGQKITRTQAMRAKCCECTCYHEDGAADCGIPLCPLYPWMPYRAGR